MNDFMIQLAHASFQGSVIIAVIFALRFALKKAPKSILCLLWLLAITRLLLPIQLESSLSLQPDVEIVIQQEYQQPESLVQTPSQQAPAVPMESIQIGDGEIIEPIYSDAIITPEQPAVFDWMSVVPWIWLTVAAGLALWSILSYLRLRSRTKNAIVLTDGVWLSPELDSAFVLGYLKPQIYLPAKLEAEEWQLVISHEQAHIRRFDHWYKLLGFITLCVHWFNPLVWLAYIFLCRDMEMACDEQVVRDMDTQQRKAYSMALLRCSADSHHFKPCPVAFAEVSVKDRIKGVLNYKKPGFWMTLVGIVAVVFVAVCFLTSPAVKDDPDDNTQTSIADYSEQELRQLCFDRLAEFQNTKYLHLYNHFFSNAGSEISDYTSEYIQADNIFWGEHCFHHADNAKFAYISVVKENDMYECYKVKSYNPLTDESTWVQVDNPSTRSMYCGFALFIDQYLDNTTPMEVQRHDNGVDCIFTVNLSSDQTQTQTLTFQFDNTSSLTSMELHDHYEDSETIQTVSIIPGTESEIQQLADDLLAAVRLKTGYQQQSNVTPTLYENDIGIAPENLFPFIYLEDTNYEFHLDILGPNDCIPGYLYVYDERTEEITQLTDFPVLDLTETQEYIFYVTQDYKIVRTNYAGDSHEVIYKSVFGAIPKIEYGYGMLTFPDGHVVVVMDLNEGSRRFAYQMENLESVMHCAVGTNLVIRADGNFLGLDYITGKTCTFPSYQAMSDFLNQGIWPQSPEVTAISDAIELHFAHKKAILLEGVTEIPEMDSCLLRDELKHKKVLDAGSLKWTGSDYLITKITLNEKGYSEALVTETVYYEIDDETLEDNTLDEVIVHITRLSCTDGVYRVEEDAYRERYTDFDSCTFSASKLEQTQKRIVAEAVEQYMMEFHAKVFYHDVTVIPEMHPLRLQDLLKHKKALDDAGIQQINSVYSIQEITLWDREYAEVTLTETATYKIEGELREAVIDHSIHLIGLETNCQVIDDGYYEPFSGFRSNSYVDPSELPD